MKQEIFGAAWKFAAAIEKSFAWRLSDTRRNEDIALFGFGRLNKRSEADALSEKCRFHGKLDNCEAEVECANVYPFGGESVIERNISVRDKLVQICVDVKPGKGEVVRDFELEELFFPGEFVSAKIVKNLPEENAPWQLEDLPLADGVLYSAAQPWVILLLTTGDNVEIELGTGGDWWRMLGAGDCIWQIEKTSGGITVKRKVVALPDDCEVQRRSWRFNYYLAWGKNSAAALADKDALVLTPDLKKLAGSGCFRAPAVRKVLRKLLRQQLENPANVAMVLPDVVPCSDAGHLERPGKKNLLHWSLDELFALYSWGNRALGFERNLQILLPQESLFRKLPSGRYLSNTPRETFIRED